MKKLLLLLLMAPIIMLGQIPDPKPGTYVNDITGLLAQSDIAKLNQQIYALEKKYSIQLAVVLTNELPANYAIEDYARELGRKWHVGNARNGLVYVAAINQRKQRLEVAANLEGNIPDIETLHLTDHIKPYFRNKDYAGGLSNLIKEIDDLLNPAIKEQKKLAEEELKKKQAKAANILLNVFLILLALSIVGITIYLIFRKRKKKEIIQEDSVIPMMQRNYSSSNGSTIIAPVVVNNESSCYNRNNDSYNSSYKSSDSDSSSSSSSDYGNWGSGSSDTSSSSDSGFSGGGSSNDW